MRGYYELTKSKTEWSLAKVGLLRNAMGCTGPSKVVVESPEEGYR